MNSGGGDSIGKAAKLGQTSNEACDQPAAGSAMCVDPPFVNILS